MKELEDIIQFENENTNLDFKSIQYKKEKYENLLKDIISMANAKTIGEKLIIVGVKHKANGEREIIGIEEEFVDDSRYQQLVSENVEPEIDFEYYPYEINSKKVGILQIKNCSDPPYMMKKEFGNLKKGDCFIRKGSHQTRVTRSDIDYYISQKKSVGTFTGSISLNFSGSKSKLLNIKRIKNLELPSEKAYNTINKIIKEKEANLNQNNGLESIIMNRGLSISGGIPYERRSISTLRENLKSVKEAYAKDDLYCLFEENSEKINIIITNSGDEYIEDSSIEITILENDFFLIAKKVYDKPDDNFLAYTINSPSWEKLNYPEIIKNEKGYKIFQNIGNIKHNIPLNAFKVPFRLFAGRNNDDKEIILKIKIFGKNLPTPFEDELKIIVNK